MYQNLFLRLPDCRKFARAVVLMLVLSTTGWGQALKGIVTDAETNKPLQQVTLVNSVSQTTTTSDDQGFFALAARNGDLISVTYLGYKTIQFSAVPGIDQNIALRPLSVKLQEYVFKDYTPFQKDSIELSILYNKELNTKPVKVGFSSANGGGISGLIGAPVKKMSKSYKRNKKFKENFKNDIEQKYIDTKYTPMLVNALTSYTGDTLATFMNTYPMDYSFARQASDLEMKMWIRNNYKDYQHKQTLVSGKK